MVQQVNQSGTKEEPVYFHYIKTKPKDEYDNSPTLIIKSSRLIGSEGTEIETTAQVFGFIKRFNYQDKNGEWQNGEQSRNWVEEVV